MASVPATSDRAVSGGADRFVARLAHSAAPVVRTPQRALGGAGTGRLATRFGDFGLRLGLSHTSRWALDAHRSDTSTLDSPVRPPISYWPWTEPKDADQPEMAQRAVVPKSSRAPVAPASTGDRKLDALMAMLGKTLPSDDPASGGSRTTPSKPVSARNKRREEAIHRGLPCTLARRGATLQAAPGDIAQRLRPEAVDVRAIGTRAAAAPPPARAPRQREAATSARPGVGTETSAPRRTGSTTPAGQRAEPARDAEGGGGPRPPARHMQQNLRRDNSAAGSGPSAQRAQLAPKARSSADVAAPADVARVAPADVAPAAPRRRADLPEVERQPTPPSSRPEGPSASRTDRPSTSPATEPIPAEPVSPRVAHAAAADVAPVHVTVVPGAVVERSDEIARAQAHPVASDAVDELRPDVGERSARPPSAPPPGDTADRVVPVVPVDRVDRVDVASVPPSAADRAHASEAPVPRGVGRGSDVADADVRHVLTDRADQSRPAPGQRSARPSAAPSSAADAEAVADDAITAGGAAVDRFAGSSPNGPEAAPEPTRAGDAVVPRSVIGRDGEVAIRRDRIGSDDADQLSVAAVERAPRPPSAPSPSVVAPDRVDAAPGAARPDESAASDAIARHDAPRTVRDEGAVRPLVPAERRGVQPAAAPARTDPVRPPIATPAGVPGAATTDLGTTTTARRPATPSASAPVASSGSITAPGRVDGVVAPGARHHDQRTARDRVEPVTHDRSVASAPRMPSSVSSAAESPTTPSHATATTDDRGRSVSASPMAGVGQLRRVIDGPRARVLIRPVDALIERQPMDRTRAAGDPRRTGGRLATLIARPPAAGAPRSERLGADNDGSRSESIVRSLITQRATSPKRPNSANDANDANDGRRPVATLTPARPGRVAERSDAHASTFDGWTPDTIEIPSRRGQQPRSQRPAAVRPAADDTGATSVADTAAAAAGRAGANLSIRVDRGQANGSRTDFGGAPAHPTGAAMSNTRPPAPFAPLGRHSIRGLGGHAPAHRRYTTGRVDRSVSRRAGLDVGRGLVPDVPTAARQAQQLQPAQVVRRTAAEISAPSADAAARFRATLQRSPASTVALPSLWRPLATAIVGERPVRMGTGPASRAALRAAGKVAATVGDTVHLARPLRGPADAPLLAHELTHVAHRSPEPRFFDDHRDSPEERRADLVADVIRRSPVLPRPGAAGLAPGAVLRRRALPTPPVPAIATRRAPVTSPAGPPSEGSGGLRSGSAASPGSISAADLAARLTRSSPQNVQRQPSPEQSWRAPTGASNVVQRAETGESEITPATSAGPVLDVNGTWPKLSRDVDSTTLNTFMDLIMEQLEDRIGREIERRGGRYRGDF